MTELDDLEPTCLRCGRRLHETDNLDDALCDDCDAALATEGIGVDLDEGNRLNLNHF